MQVFYDMTKPNNGKEGEIGSPTASVALTGAYHEEYPPFSFLLIFLFSFYIFQYYLFIILFLLLSYNIIYFIGLKLVYNYHIYLLYYFNFIA